MTSLAAAVLLLGQARPPAAGKAGSTAPTIAYDLDLPGGQTAKVFSNGVAAVFSKDRRKVEFRAYPVTPRYDEAAGQTGLPDKAQLIADLAAGAKALYADGRVLVVFASGVTGTSDVVSGRGAAFTNDSTTGINNNAMSSAVVMNEHGNVLSIHEQFFLFNTFLTIGANNLQLNPATRSAYTLGPGQQQLAPFTY